MNVGSFSHRRTCSIRLSWMGFRCSRVTGSPCSTSNTKRSLAGTFLGYGLFQNSEKGGFCRGCLGGSGANRSQVLEFLASSLRCYCPNLHGSILIRTLAVQEIGTAHSHGVNYIQEVGFFLKGFRHVVGSLLG